MLFVDCGRGLSVHGIANNVEAKYLLALSIYVYRKAGLGFRPSNKSFMQLKMKVYFRFPFPEVFNAKI